MQERASGSPQKKMAEPGGGGGAAGAGMQLQSSSVSHTVTPAFSRLSREMVAEK